MIKIVVYMSVFLMIIASASAFFEGDGTIIPITTYISSGTPTGYNETDPQVADTTLNKWCIGTGTQVNCSENSPISGSGYVPYTGANASVDLGDNSLDAWQLNFTNLHGNTGYFDVGGEDGDISFGNFIKFVTDVSAGNIYDPDFDASMGLYWDYTGFFTKDFEVNEKAITFTATGIEPVVTSSPSALGSAVNAWDSAYIATNGQINFGSGYTLRDQSTLNLTGGSGAILQLQSASGTDTYVKLISTDETNNGYFGIRGTGTKATFFSGSSAFEVQRYGGSTALFYTDTSSGGNGYTGIGVSNTAPVSTLDVGSTTGAITTIKRIDTSITADDSIGKIQFYAKDTSTLTNPIAANIESQAITTIGSDINPGRLIFRTTPTTTSATPIEAMRITEKQNIGIGATTNVEAKLTIYESGTNNPGLQLNDGDVTMPSYSSLSFKPAINTNTIGFMASYSATTGGIQMTGFTSSGSNTGNPFALVGYHGGTSPTTPAISIIGYKHNGGTNRASLAGTEKISSYYNGADERMIVYGDKGAWLYGTLNATLNITANGQVTTQGNYYEDLRFPAMDMTKGGVTDPTASSFINGTRLLYFQPSTANQELFLEVQLPHGWREGTTIYPHFHWLPTTINAGNVTWCFEYGWANRDDVFANETTTSCTTDESMNATNRHQMSDSITISASGKTYSSMIIGRIYRASVATTDTYPNDAGLLEFDIHYINEKFGQ